jgi:5-methylcytosine-specific restriction endonuclease McrA
MCSDSQTVKENPQSRWAKRNPEKIKAYKAAYRARHPEVDKQYRDTHKRTGRDQREYLKAYYWKNKAARKEKEQFRYQANREKIIASVKAYRKNNLEKVKAAQRRHNKEHPEKSKLRSKKWLSTHREYVKRYRKEYRKKHPEKWKANNHNRRALVRASTVNLKKIEAWMASIMAKPSASCYWCGASVSKSNLHFDHIVALSKGGPHSVENLCVSCAPCNLSKHNKDVVAWIRVGQQVLSL